MLTYDQLGRLGGSLRYHVELQRPVVGDKTNLKENLKNVTNCNHETGGAKTSVLWIRKDFCLDADPTFWVFPDPNDILELGESLEIFNCT